MLKRKIAGFFLVALLLATSVAGISLGTSHFAAAESAPLPQEEF